MTYLIGPLTPRARRALLRGARGRPIDLSPRKDDALRAAEATGPLITTALDVNVVFMTRNLERGNPQKPERCQREEESEN
jgi:hypothetical protein